uniref:Leukocyte receptor cluster member 1 homolog n=1 Tax=Crassostrea virginica TaxID=6565 RepID=A0A8B8EF30_CRAVI|nr:leukocyte receptor cluster member 1 homolog [Crassostrea virginica]
MAQWFRRRRKYEKFNNGDNILIRRASFHLWLRSERKNPKPILFICSLRCSLYIHRVRHSTKNFKMNILHHKSWHVRNKNNIERVRRDEEKAALEEKEKQRKIALAEQEARTEYLRLKSRKRIEDAGESSKQLDEGKTEEHGESAVSTYGAGALSDDIYSGKHINFFKETDGVVVSDKKNTEHEAEKKKEQEEWEKKVGILTYLGQSSNETSASWYNQRKRKHDDVEEEEDYEKKKRKEKNRKLQDHLDPIRQMTSYLDKKKKESKNEGEKHKKHKKKKHKEEKEKSKSKHKSSSSKGKPKVSIEQLRAERLKREREERQRTVQVLAKHRGEKVEPEPEEPSERERQYNSQFNPEFARKSKGKYRDK